MKRNMGLADKTIRSVIAIIIAVLYLTDQIIGTIGIVLLILAGVFLFTSFIGFCPLYWPFGISTKKRR